MDDLDVNMAIWGIFLNTTLQAAVHLGQDYEANLRYVKNYFWNCVGQLSNETGKLISEQKEIIGVNIIEFKDYTWMSTSLLCSQAYRITHAKAYVFSGDENGRWSFFDLKFKRYSENNHFKVMNRIDGMPTEFQWKNIHNVGPHREDSQSFERPRAWTWALQWQDHLLDIVNVQWRIMLANSFAVIGLSWGLDQKRNGAEPTLTNQTDHWIKLQRTWWQISQDPVIQ